MAKTTTTTLTTLVPAENIVAEVLQEARPFNVVAPLVLNADQGYYNGKTWNQNQLPTTTAASVAEGTDITCTARTTTESTVTVAEVGLGTDLTDLAQETARPGAGLLDWAASQGRAIAQKVTGDLCALFAALNGSTAVGTTSVDMTVASFVEAMYTLDNANAPGGRRCVLHPRQWADLTNAIVSAGGTVYSNLPELIRNGRLPTGLPSAGFVGELFAIPVYVTTEVDAVNSNADRCGAMFVRDAMAFVQLRPVRAEYQRDASARATEIIVTTAYGVGEVVDAYGVPIETDL